MTTERAIEDFHKAFGDFLNVLERVHLREIAAVRTEVAKRNEELENLSKRLRTEG